MGIDWVLLCVALVLAIVIDLIFCWPEFRTALRRFFCN